ncbi:hypothetical protein SPRG_00712 [Saprolegnia parasitica CBS 223.65]|uniref:Tudor domain-containing protein n=1 Tax=Saprolegnia parasitica (strain CBS 223.65) TaxID=695850 RepID=A0A067CZG9_SAPPC|nr:hypothetical protein SPRG_00712 [Saprolegnia parasitica CBS 223.65]KDO34650.1 hypothetical protein SPRG_00712 [Saprolegnia parasitica CBS 223.65]|eukprot:XP_012194324.1 hypothetical protein SPRG_00712 [Saprolegnia parasitica CBS 223.65]
MDETLVCSVEEALRDGLVAARIDEAMVDYVVELVLAAWEDAYTTTMAKPRKKKATPLEPDAVRAQCLASAIEETLLDAQPTLQLDPTADIRSLISDTQARLHDVLYPPPPAPTTSPFVVGSTCLAILEEDDEWHEAEITSVEDVATKQCIQVNFIEFDKRQDVPISLVVLPDDIAESDVDGVYGCELCERGMNLTAHHLVPRQCHAKFLQRGFSREYLNRTILICRQCHSKIHATEDNKALARDYNTLEKLLGHEAIARYVQYARKQKTRVRPRGQKQG